MLDAGNCGPLGPILSSKCAACGSARALGSVALGGSVARQAQFGSPGEKLFKAQGLYARLVAVFRVVSHCGFWTRIGTAAVMCNI